jgi:putative ATP-binding cassette transporter
MLSLGEQQRIAFARALLLQPAFLYLDEATSQLDEESEGQLYVLLRKRLPQAALVSIGHRSALTQLHERQLQFTAPSATLAAE